MPGPTIRATEGDRVRVTFATSGTHPHTMHFHGWHPPAHGRRACPSRRCSPATTFVYEFDADPFGLHLYHCHTVPLKRHIHKGLYGAFIVDPRGGRPPADEMVMVMNAFDTNFDAENEVYAVNTVANAYMHDPIRVTVGRPRSDLPRQRHRVRSGQQPAPSRDVLRRLPHRHLVAAAARRPTR